MTAQEIMLKKVEEFARQHFGRRWDFSFVEPSQLKVIVEPLPFGLWNFNYLVTFEGKKYVFKVYSENVPGLLFQNKAEDEFEALRQLMPTVMSRVCGVAPIPHLSAHIESLGKRMLVYYFVEGKNPQRITDSFMKRLAKTLAKIHSTKLYEPPFIPKKETSPALYKQILATFKKFEESTGGKGAEFFLFKKLIKRCSTYSSLFSGEHPLSLVHNDLAPCNLIDDGKKVTVIDWQNPSLSDPAFDVWACTAEPFFHWDLAGHPTKEQKELFLKTYLSLRKDESLPERITLKAPLYYLNIGLYCALRYHNFISGKIPVERTQGREHLWEKYKKVKEVCLEQLKKAQRGKIK